MVQLNHGLKISLLELETMMSQCKTQNRIISLPICVVQMSNARADQEV